MWSLGRLLAALLSGRVEGRVDLRAVPAEVRHVVQQCLADDPDRRPASADALYTDLRAMAVGRLVVGLLPGLASEDEGFLHDGDDDEPTDMVTEVAPPPVARLVAVLAGPALPPAAPPSAAAPLPPAPPAAEAPPPAPSKDRSAGPRAVAAAAVVGVVALLAALWGVGWLG